MITQNSNIVNTFPYASLPCQLKKKNQRQEAMGKKERQIAKTMQAKRKMNHTFGRLTKQHDIKLTITHVCQLKYLVVY